MALDHERKSGDWHALEGRFGLASVQHLLRGHDEPRIYNAVAMVHPTGLSLGHELLGAMGAAGYTKEQARLGALGELVERYSAAIFDSRDLVFASEDELGSDARGLAAFGDVDPSARALADFPLPPWRRDTKVHWVEAQSLTSGAKRFVPANLVYVPWTPGDGRQVFLPAYSTGQACHTDRDRAVLSGLCEVVERDAFMISWLRKLELPEVRYLEDPELSELYRRHFAGCPLRMRVFDMTLDIELPSMICFAEGRSNGKAFLAVGAATRPTAREATRKALLEAAQTATWCHHLMHDRSEWQPLRDGSNLREFEHHVRLYCDPGMRSELAFLLEGVRTAPPRPEPSTVPSLAGCIERVAARGLEPLVVDLAPRAIRSLGFHVVKVLIPGAVPLTADSRFPQTSSHRLVEAPRRAGYRVDPGRALNPAPHPFP
jgi:ribosomal protein S12 methylthiotransferase accessory factor